MTTDRILFFDDIRKDSYIRKAVQIAQAVQGGNAERKKEVLSEYYELQRYLVRSVRYGDPQLSYWQNYVLERTAFSENPFSLASEKGTADSLLFQLAEGDLRDIKELLSISWETVAEWLDEKRPCVCSLSASMVKEDQRLGRLYEILSQPPSEAVRDLAEYYRQHMCGLAGRYRELAWDGKLRGIEEPDPVTFEELIGYELQQEKLIKNTRMFLEGKGANNVLLYGDKGTGKSSSVKALMNHFAGQGLRMISLPKDRILEITDIMDYAAGRGGRFLIFIDDLSFEATEIEYKKFKSVLEGDVEIRPDNVLIYVTTNRRNLVKELWSDRGDPQEIHGRDGVQEIQSLADRFGLTITFPSPGKSLYNEMVLAIAGREGVELDQETLLREANQWDMRQTGRSGRSARQFITYIAGK